MQKGILEDHPDLDIRVYAVWFATVSADRRDRWPRGALTDRRVTHFWDEGKVVGREYAVLLDSPGQVAWDLCLFYPAGRWSLRSPDAILAWGVPVLDARERLGAALDSIRAAAGG